MIHSSARHTQYAVTASVAYAALVVYGSLLPFDYRPHTMAQAIGQFTHIPWLQLKDTSRADWVANLVLYIPLAFFMCTALVAGAQTLFTRYLRLFFVYELCLLLAIGVEFTQIFFAPRTVSLNDLLAESIGSLLGIVFWILWRKPLTRLWLDFLAGGRQSLIAATVAFAIAYLTMALFPFDFILSGAEMTRKLASGTAGWILSNGEHDPLRILIRLAAESVAIAPLGILIGLLVGQVQLRRVFIAGLIIGVVLEVMQMLIVSGISQGASVLMRGIGLTIGASIGQQARHTSLSSLAYGIRRLAPIMLPFYLLTLAVASGWARMSLLSNDAALAKTTKLHLMPFYYHYFTSEPVAMASLLANLALYAPLGILAWARQTTIHGTRHNGLWQPAWWAVLLATPVEASKLWLSDAHPDPTNVLVAAVGASLTYALIGWLARTSRQSQSATNNTSNPRRETPLEPPRRRPRRAAMTLPATRHRLVSLGATALLLVALWDYPVSLLITAPLVLGYGLLIWRYPWSWLLVIPAALPVLDFAPYTGRLLLDAFDLLILVTLALGYWRTLSEPPRAWVNRIFPFGVLLLLLSTILATARGLIPLLHGASLNMALSHSPIEALVVGKGSLWALLLLPLLRRMPRPVQEQYRYWLLDGLAAGLALLSLVVLWERHVFVGIGDTDNVFRVTGTFSSMYNGGAYIEAFIAVAFPALILWTLRQTGHLLRLGGFVMVGLASYAMLVTFSRGGYAGLVSGLGITLFFAWRARSRATFARPILIGLLLTTATAAAPVFLGGFAQERLQQAGQDLQIRLAHWQRAIGLMDDDVLSVVSGMGFGRYPALYLWRAEVNPAPGTFGIQSDPHSRPPGHYLRLGSGDAYFLDQIVSLDPHRGYTVQARVRFIGKVDTLHIPLCEKALLYSFQCTHQPLQRPPDTPPDQWIDLSTPLHTGGLGNSGRWPAPTLKFTLGSPSGQGAVDIDWIHVIDRQGKEWLRNGDFEQGLAHWLPATDRDLAWHIHQSPLEVYFAQGLLGLSATILLLLAAARGLQHGLRRGDAFSIAVAGGLVGFLTVGLLGSTMDTPRLAFLFYLLIFSTQIAGQDDRRHREGR